MAMEAVIDGSIALAAAALLGVIVSAFVTAGNYSGINGIISGLFVTVILALAIFGAFMGIRKMTKSGR